MDALHYALLAVVLLLAVYCGASFFREGINTSSHNTRARGSVQPGFKPHIMDKPKGWWGKD